MSNGDACDDFFFPALNAMFSAFCSNHYSRCVAFVSGLIFLIVIAICLISIIIISSILHPDPYP